MKIKIYWNTSEAEKLLELVNISIDELWLSDFITIESIKEDELLKQELNISKDSALIIEEESIDFKDMIFEWIIPEIDELKSMFISIIWWGESSWWCGSWGCGSWCSC